MKRVVGAILAVALAVALTFIAARLLRPSGTEQRPGHGQPADTGMPAPARTETSEETPPMASTPPSPPAPAEHAAPPPRTPEGEAEGERLRAEAQALLRRVQIREALAVFERAIAADPSAENHAAYGRVLRDLTAMNRALYHLRAAAEADPGNADRWIELANAYRLKPDPGEAWKAERRAREAEPGLRLRREGGKVVREDHSTAPAE